MQRLLYLEFFNKNGVQKYGPQLATLANLKEAVATKDIDKSKDDLKSCVDLSTQMIDDLKTFVDVFS